jgi:predicted metal-binding membrane protein
MKRTARRLDAWLAVLGSMGLLAWSVLALEGSDLILPPFCSGALGAVPLSVSVDLALVFNSPAELALHWALMVVAMMSPLVIAPLRHVRDRTFARRRVRAMLLFVVGYAMVWMAVGVGLQTITLVVRWAFPTIICLGLAVGAAMWWQVSPAKQWCLNRCHRRPPLAAFGAPAARDVFDFGLRNGASCAGACWALMLLTLFLGHGQVLGMIAVTLFVFAERLEDPAPLVWRWRGPTKVLRIVTMQVRMRLAAGS